MRSTNRYYILALLLAICVLLEVVSYTYMQDSGDTWYYSSSVINFLSGLLICIIPLLHTNKQHTSPAFISKYIPAVFYLLLAVMLFVHITVLIPLYKAHAIDPRVADMIPSIQLACKRFLSGQTVYGPAPEIKPGGIIPYLPAMWIPFLPSEIFKFDARWTTVSAFFISLAVAGMPLVRKRYNLPVTPALITLLSLFLLMNYFLQRQEGFWWMTQETVVAGFYVLLGCALLRKNYWLTGLAITGCTLSRYSLLMWVPVYFGYVFFTEQRSNFLKLCLSFGGSMLLLFVLPYFIHNPQYFFNIPATYGSFEAFWERNNIEEHGYFTTGLFKFFHSGQLNLMFRLQVITSFLAPLLLFLSVRWLLARKAINTQYIGFAGLKLSLLFFYGFMQAPYIYLAFVPTLLSYAVLLYFLSDTAQNPEPGEMNNTPFYNRKHSGAWIAVLGTTALLLFYYGYNIANANYLNYAQWGDGYKNYYTLAYYLQNDKGTHFTGMNYPYGENVIFTDNQPALAWLLKPVCQVFPWIANNIHAILAALIFLGIVFSAYLIYRILSEFELSEWGAGLFAILIALMAPQILRLNGHFALAYTCFLPLLLLLLIRYFKTGGSFKLAFYITALLSFFAFIHVYYIAMAGMFILLVVLFFALSHIRQLKKHIRFLWPLVVSALIPFVLVKGYLKITDPVTDRPHSPWGFVESRSTVADIFLNTHSFTGNVIERISPQGSIIYHFEGSAYIGLASTLTLAVLIIFSFTAYSKAKELNSKYYLYTFMLPAVMVLLYAMAFPFSITGLEQYYEKMPTVVKQFRASGRFSWVFYYAAVIYTAVLVYHLYRHLISRQKKALAVLLIITTLSVWAIEMNMISTHLAFNLKKGSNETYEEQEKKDLLDRLHHAGKQVKDFQAIITFPFFHNGSERIYLDHPTAFNAMQASLFTGLPLINTKMSRTSESQSFRIVNLVGSPYIQKDVLKDFRNGKPLLLAAYEDKFSPAEQTLIAQGKLLFAGKDAKYYELPLSAFNDSTGFAKLFVDQAYQSLYNHGTYRSTDSLNNAVAVRFEEASPYYKLAGKAGYYTEKGQVKIYDDTLPGAVAGTAYELSVWVYADEHSAAFPTIYLTQNNSSGAEIERYDIHPKFSTNTYGRWVRCQVNFTLHHPLNTISAYMNDAYIGVDELLIRPEHVTVITGTAGDSVMLYNNFPVQ